MTCRNLGLRACDTLIRQSCILVIRFVFHQRKLQLDPEFRYYGWIEGILLFSGNTPIPIILQAVSSSSIVNNGVLMFTAIPIMSNVLIVGATRGLGASLAKKYAGQGAKVFGTSRSTDPPASTPKIIYIPSIDVAQESAGQQIAHKLKSYSSIVDIVIITAGCFETESFDEPSWEDEVKMYTTSAIGPVFIVHHLVKAGLCKQGTKIILVSSESGSITLRHETEGGGNYGHHASKAAENMVGKLLSLDLKEKGIAVGLVHPGFMVSRLWRV